MTNRKTTFALLLAASLCSAFAYAQDGRGTPEQQTACARDAFRLCASDIPDAGRVASCLWRKRSDLNPVCRSAFERGADALARAK